MGLKVSSTSGRSYGAEFGIMLLLLVAAISALMHESFVPGQVPFSSDGPPGRLLAQCHQLPQVFTGVWEDLYSVGYREQGGVPNITYGLLYLLKPMLFSKFYAPIAMVILGLGAWFFFREFGFSKPACILGGLAAALNTQFFSTACWGVAAHPLAVGMTFFALAALQKTSSWRGWIRVAVAGCAVGMGVAEGADVGAILSMYLAAYVIYQAFVSETPRMTNLFGSLSRVGIIAVFAGFVAARSITGLVGTQIEGVVGMEQNEKTREERWDWATEWSLPKAEAFSLVVPGLFGYRMDSLGGGAYWGHIGRNPTWERYFANGQQGNKPKGLLRQTGSGIYAGVLVVLIALWAVAQSFRRNDSVFSPLHRKWIWFWLAVMLVSLMFGFGRFAPFYQFVYRLPYFSTIRNPVKFIALVNFALIILFAFGVDGLWRRYLDPARAMVTRAASSVRFDTMWLWGCVVTFGIALVSWMIYASSRPALEEYLRGEMFRDPLPQAIAAYSVQQVGWFVLFFVLASVVMGLILKGHFSGVGSKRMMGLLAILLLLDLSHADLPWITYWDYSIKYADNPVIDMLSDKPYEHRVVQLPFPPPPNLTLMGDLYHYEWEQHLIPSRNIQSLDIVQLPRFPEDLAAFLKATAFNGSTTNRLKLTRYWQLTNTRYALGPAGFLDTFNNQIDPEHRRLRYVARFNIVQRPGATSIHRLERITAALNPEGEYALFEFTGALPRAKLYSNWQIITNNQAALDAIVAPEYDAEHIVTVEGGVAQSNNSNTNLDAGTVDFASYAPKDIVLKADVKTPAVLLLNDRFESNWKVTVDGKSAPLLRCNFLMRGVSLEPGSHTVEFRFLPNATPLYVSLAGVSVALVLVGIVFIPQRREQIVIETKASGAQPKSVESPPAKTATPRTESAAAKPVSPPVTLDEVEANRRQMSKKERRRVAKGKR